MGKITGSFRRLTSWTGISFVVAFVLTLLAPTVAFAAFNINEYPYPSGGLEARYIVAGPDGNLWSPEPTTNKIAKISTAGNITEYTVPTGSSSPWGITVGPDSNLWFTEETGNKIGSITTGGSFNTEYTVPTSNSEPYGITKGPDGNLWFTENTGNKIGKVTTSGTFNQYNIPTSSSGSLNIVAGPDGNLWFTEEATGKIASITTSGTIVEYSVTGNPDGIVVGPDGNLWYTDEAGNGAIDNFNITSHTVTRYIIPTTGADPTRITVGPDSNLWFTETGGNKIGYINPNTHVIKEFTVPTSTAGPQGITAGPDNNIWFTEAGAGQVGDVVMPLAPAISNQSEPLLSGQSQTLNVVAGIANDPDSSTLAIVSGPNHGTASANTSSGTITYASTSGYFGSDNVTYTLCSLDDSGICAQAVLAYSISLPTKSTVGAPNTGYGVAYSSPWKTIAEFAVGSSALLGLALATRRFAKR